MEIKDGQGVDPIETNANEFIKTKYGNEVLRQFTPEELKISYPGEKETAEGFKVHGVNETELIKSLEYFKGYPIASYETVMKPGKYSEIGFLGKNESFIEVLAKDNDTVLEKDYIKKVIEVFIEDADERTGAVL